ncbi:hypothetical protein HDR70_02250 [bacterium]|nr:hypothetical protein [bacterium]
MVREKLLKYFLMFLVACVAKNLDATNNAIITKEFISSSGMFFKNEESVNSVNFEIHAEKEGDYYVEFWMMPARHIDNSYSKYIVRLNGKYVGNITSSTGNWQGLRIDGNKTIHLQKGLNIISVATLAPEFPILETLRLSLDDSQAVFSVKDYQEYLSEAKKGERGSLTQEKSIFGGNSASTDSSDENTFKNVPLEYTFFTTQLFTEGQDIFIASSSSSEHVIDMIYFGSGALPDVLNSDNFETSVVPNSWEFILPDVTPLKPRLVGPSATSAEMQGLNWRGPSEYSINNTAYLAKIHVTIPKTGYYFIRLRTKETGTIGVADLNINGDYFYEEVPISFTEVACCIPANEDKYACFTEAANPSIDDPILYVQSFLGGRIVGVNDDCSSSAKNLFHIGACDAYLAQVYQVKTSGISVSSYYSNSPKSTCNITVRKLNTSNRVRDQLTYDKANLNFDMPDGYIDGYPYIDLGLPSGTLWALHNLGAVEATDYGNYYSWGEVAPKDEYSWETYEFYDKEFFDPNMGGWYSTINIGDDIKGTRFDAATMNWGKAWTTPTEDQMRELRRHCWYEWTEQDDICGVRVYGPNEHSIFFPASGIVEVNNGLTTPYANKCGIYWSSTQSVMKDKPKACNQAAYTLLFDSGTLGINDNQQKYSGISIRPVTFKQSISSLLNIDEESVVIKRYGEEIIVKGCKMSDRIEIYNLSGQLMVSEIASENLMRFRIKEKGLYIVSVVDGKSIKKNVKLIL